MVKNTSQKNKQRTKKQARKPKKRRKQFPMRWFFLLVLVGLVYYFTTPIFTMILLITIFGMMVINGMIGVWSRMLVGTVKLIANALFLVIMAGLTVYFGGAI